MRKVEKVRAVEMQQMTDQTVSQRSANSRSSLQINNHDWTQLIHLLYLTQHFQLAPTQLTQPNQLTHTTQLTQPTQLYLVKKGE